MLLQFSSLCEWLVALCTNVGILPSVNEHMSARFPAWLNHFLNSVHLCGFSPLWVSMCQIMWLRNSCTRCICLDSLQCVFWCNISWATVPVEKLHWLNFWAMGIEKNIFGSIHWEQQRMSGELFNETDNKFYIFYFGQQGLWAQGFGKMEQKWQFMGKKC